MLYQCMHNSILFLALHYCTFQAARHAAVIISQIFLIINIVRRGEVVLNDLNEGLLICTAGAQECIDCPSDLIVAILLYMDYSIAAVSGYYRR